MNAQQAKAACFPSKSKHSLTQIQIAKSPCANGNIFKENLPNNLNYSFDGFSNYNECKSQIRSLLFEGERSKPCETSDGMDLCSYNTAHVPDIKHNKFLVNYANLYWELDLIRIYFIYFERRSPRFGTLTVRHHACGERILMVNTRLSWKLLKKCAQWTWMRLFWVANKKLV